MNTPSPETLTPNTTDNSNNIEGINRTPPNTRGENGTLYVFRHVLRGLPPSFLWRDHLMPKPTVQRHLKRLQNAGFIEKVAYGVWEAVETEVTLDAIKRRSHFGHGVTHQQGITSCPEGIKPDSDRMHGVRVTLDIPRLEGWDDRAAILQAAGIPSDDIAQGQRILFEGRKVWLCRESVIMYLRNESWFADTSDEAVRASTRDVLAMVRRLENALHVASFRTGKGYRFRFSAQHHALIKNAFARQLNEEGEKLRVSDENGLWLLVDDSFNLGELEAVHPKTAPGDFKAVQSFMNCVKKGEITVDGLREMRDTVSGSVGLLAKYAEQIALHLGVEERQADNQETMNVALGELREALRSMLMSGVVRRREPEEDAPIDGERVQVEFTKFAPKFRATVAGGSKEVGPFNPGARMYFVQGDARRLVNEGMGRLVA